MESEEPLEPVSADTSYVEDGPPDHADAEALLTSQPLFEPGRRQPVPVQYADQTEPLPAAQPETQPEATPMLVPPQVSMRGAILMGDQWKALVVGPDGIEQWLDAGAQLGDWTIETIDANGMQLRGGEQVLTVQLYP
ncbi:hypothetical protein [Stagnihabitans tardus]|uniref:Uncharacterized protein n=1 Tax=Stagnihabitans tardus TaxID=2699202 RepID=A0AAE4YHS9_9RHOB|nr:hypothetical protein [Stagnihabitans tardus]NBZ90075.1 hypothetical protein [Stagnihabitans tardus]